MPSIKTRNFMPDENASLISKNIKQFYYWIFERQEIWFNRFVLKKKRPWTADKILDDYKFTNAYRELDRNTQWLINKVIKVEKDEFEVFWKIIVFRYFNLPELFEFIGGVPSYKKFNKENFEKKVLSYKEKYGRIFTRAYMINPPKKPKDIEIGIERFYVNNILNFHNKAKEMWKRYKQMNNPKEFNKLLTELDSIANFLAYEVYCDLCYTDWFKWGENDFVNIGPGAMFGLELLFPNLFKNRKKERYEEKLYFLKDHTDDFLEIFGLRNFKYYNENDHKKYKKGKRISLRVIEHSLCEYSKYWKMVHGVGKPRQKFEPRS